ELVVLLYQGNEKEADLCAQFCAQERAKDPTFPRVDVILYADEKESEPADKEQRVGQSILINVGHKGRNVGVVGAYRPAVPGQPWQLRYQRVEIGPEYETPKGMERTNPVIALMQDYADEVKNGNFLAKYPRKKPRVQGKSPAASSVGSERCEKCPPHVYKVWSKPKHMEAYDTLEKKAVRPTNRQFDGECLVCHVVGFEF